MVAAKAKVILWRARAREPKHTYTRHQPPVSFIWCGLANFICFVIINFFLSLAFFLIRFGVVSELFWFAPNISRYVNYFSHSASSLSSTLGSAVGLRWNALVSSTFERWQQLFTSFECMQHFVGLKIGSQTKLVESVWKLRIFNHFLLICNCTFIRFV